MERLTEYTGEGQAIPRMDLKNNGHQRCMERLAEYEDLEEQGKLLKLPCAVGDTLHFLCREHFGDYFAENYGDILSVYVKNILFSDPSYGINFDNYEFLRDDIGKTVFLNREEAEDALKEL